MPFSNDAHPVSYTHLETPFTEEEFRNEKKDTLAEKTFNIAMENFKRKTELLAQIANTVIKQVYENQGHMYENILIPITCLLYTSFRCRISYVDN